MFSFCWLLSRLFSHVLKEMAYSAIGAVFSPKTDYFACASLDGCLRIWETSSNTLKQEYTPSCHLSSTCSSLSWGPCQQREFYGGKKAKKNRQSNAVADLNLIAMGTLTGEILLYSVTNGDLYGKLTGGHNQGVSDISWFAEEDSLFTCSADQYIVRWSISTGSIVTKWKCGKVAAISVIDKDNLLSASRTILWWDLKEQTVIKKFTGHAYEVFCLAPIFGGEKSANSRYFLSSAVGDRVINVWQLNKDSDCNAVASFTLSDEPATLDISKNDARTQPLVLSAVTKNGVLHVFEHQLNGHMKKPLSAKSSLQIASMANNKSKSQPLLILSAMLSDAADSCVMAYGTFMKPTFERMELQNLQKDTFLIRENRVSASGFQTLEGSSKVKQPDRPNDVKHLGPGYMIPTKPTENVSRKKKRKGDSINELPMEERLNAVYLGQAPEIEEVPEDTPNAESMVHLLLQGLQSKDNKLLNTVLRSSNEESIRNTVERLPLQSVPQLLVVLHERLSKKDHGNRPCLRWLKSILSVHLSYLMSLQEIDEYIGPVSQLIEAREETFPKMTQLKGFLDILWSQIDFRTEKSTDISSEPLNVYEDESSSEEIEDDEIETDHSEEHSEVESQSEESDEEVGEESDEMDEL